MKTTRKLLRKLHQALEDGEISFSDMNQLVALFDANLSNVDQIQSQFEFFKNMNEVTRSSSKWSKQTRY